MLSPSVKGTSLALMTMVAKERRGSSRCRIAAGCQPRDHAATNRGTHKAALTTRRGDFAARVEKDSHVRAVSGKAWLYGNLITAAGR